MTVNYTTNLALGQPVTGTESGTWGDDVNNAVTSYLDIAIAGGLATTITTADVTLTLTQGTSAATNISSTTAQYAIINVSGAKTAARSLIVPSSSRHYVINNAAATGGFLLTVKGLATTGVTLVDGEKAIVAWNGTDYVKISSSVVSNLTGTLPVANGGTGTTTPNIVAGTNITVSGTWPNQTINSSSSGTVTSVSVTSANGFAGTVATATTTPAITVSTSITGVLKGNGTAISAAVAGTDYQAPITLTTTGTSGAATFTSNTLNIPQYTGSSSSTLTISNKTAAYTVVAGDLGTVINCTSGTFTVSLTAAATLGTGFNVQIINTGTGVITIDPAGAETLDANTTWQLSKGQGIRILCDGTNFQTIAIRTSGQSANSVALGNNSGGTPSVAITGAGAMALGGSYASGVDSFAAAVADNTSTYGATGANSVAIGPNAKSSGVSGVAIGRSTIASGSLGALALGGFGGTTASGDGSIAIGGGYSGAGAAAAVEGSVAINDYAHVPTTKGKYAFTSSGSFAQGGSQTGMVVLRRPTTNATASTLGSNGLVGGSDNQLILPNNSAFAFTGTIVARQQAAGGTASAAWTIEGLIRREGTAASTTLVASTVTAISNVPAWVIALTADTTNGGLTVTATGAAATNIRWVATINTSEVIYV